MAGSWWWDIFNQPYRSERRERLAPEVLVRVNRWTRRNKALKDYLEGKEVECWAHLHDLVFSSTTGWIGINGKLLQGLPSEIVLLQPQVESESKGQVEGLPMAAFFLSSTLGWIGITCRPSSMLANWRCDYWHGKRNCGKTRTTFQIISPFFAHTRGSLGNGKMFNCLTKKCSEQLDLVCRKAIFLILISTWNLGFMYHWFGNNYDFFKHMFKASKGQMKER